MADEPKRPPGGIMGTLARLFGQPERKPENGHEWGCICQECRDLTERRWAEMRARRKRGEKPETIGEMLMKRADGKKPS